MGLERALDREPTGKRTRVDVASGHLVGSECARCHAVAWPGRAVCHRCGSDDVGEHTFAGTARLQSFTRVAVARPGLDAPYLLGQVVVDGGGPVLFGRLDGDHEPAALPCTVRIAVRQHDTGDTAYSFELLDSEPQQHSSEEIAG